MNIFGWLTEPLIKRRLLNQLKRNVEKGFPDRLEDVEIKGKKYSLTIMRPELRKLIKEGAA